MRTCYLGLLSLALSFFLPAGALRAEPAKKPIPVLLDTDIGDDVDDAFALALLLHSPELDLRGVTTVYGDSYTRALIVCKLLRAAGRLDVPVASASIPRPVGSPAPQKQMRYGTWIGQELQQKQATLFLYDQLKARPGELTIVAVGPLTNIADLFANHPDCKPWVKRLVLMAGSVRVGYKNKPPAEVEWNVKCDIKAAQAVFASGVPLVVAPLDATVGVKLDEAQRRRIFKSGRPLGKELETLYKLWNEPTPTLYDPVAIALCFNEEHCKMENLRLEVDDKGMMREVTGRPNARVATYVRRDDFLRWFVDRLAPARAEKK